MNDTVTLFPPEAQARAARIAAVLRAHDDYILCAHAALDGDAASSLAGMGYILQALGKRFVLYSSTGVPASLAWLPLPAHVHTKLSPLPFQPRTALILDCGDAHRTGEEMAALLPPSKDALPCINIDHHRGNPHFGTLDNWVEPDYAATAQLTAYIACAAGLELTGPLAENIGLGLLTDTGGFAHGNTSPQVLALAAHLAALGLKFSRLREQLDNQWSSRRMRLWGRLMQKIALHRGRSVACSTIPYALFMETGTTKEDLEGFVEMMRRLKGVKATVMLREDAPDICKFSLRSSGSVDVRAAAATLGGGGHTNAAGGTLRMPLAQAAAAILQAVTAELDAEGL